MNAATQIAHAHRDDIAILPVYGPDLQAGMIVEVPDADVLMRIEFITEFGDPGQPSKFDVYGHDQHDVWVSFTATADAAVRRFAWKERGH